MTDDTINKIDAQQNSRMAVLEQQLKDLKEDVDRVTQEENERLKGRIRHLEKWVAGAGAVIAVAVAGLGLVEVTDFGFAKTGTHVEEHRDYFKDILHPAMVRDNWLGEDCGEIYSDGYWNDDDCDDDQDFVCSYY